MISRKQTEAVWGVPKAGSTHLRAVFLDQPFARAAMTRQVTSAIKGRPFGWPVLDVLLIRRAGNPGTCRWVARRETICDSFVVQPLLFANL
jgi:hypothetical protein